MLTCSNCLVLSFNKKNLKKTKWLSLKLKPKSCVEILNISSFSSFGMQLHTSSCSSIFLTDAYHMSKDHCCSTSGPSVE